MKILKIFSKVFDIVAFLILLSIFVFFADYYQSLPDKVPLGLSGVNVIWGSKLYFVILLWMALISQGVLYVLRRFPELTPYPVKLTPMNFMRQRQILQFFFSAASSIIAAIYFMIILLLYYRSHHISDDFRFYLYIVFALFGVLLMNFAVYIIVARCEERRGKI